MEKADGSTCHQSNQLIGHGFESRRASYIGAHPSAPPVVVPPDTPPTGSAGELVTRTIAFAYDALYRVTDVTYSSGEEFHYVYDPVGNVTQYTRTVAGQTIVTTYTYNEGNQLTTAQADNDSTVWHYLYDNNGSLTDVIPNGTTPANGAPSGWYVITVNPQPNGVIKFRPKGATGCVLPKRK